MRVCCYATGASCDVAGAKLGATVNGNSVSVDFVKPPNAADNQRTLRINFPDIAPGAANGTVICAKVRREGQAGAA
jgi:hypothetical protein